MEFYFNIFFIITYISSCASANDAKNNFHKAKKYAYKKMFSAMMMEEKSSPILSQN